MARRSKKSKKNSNPGNQSRAARSPLQRANSRPAAARAAPPGASPAQPLFSQGIVHLQKGLLDQAATAFRTAIRLDARHALAHNCLGIVLKAQGKFDEATVSYQAALGVDPGLAEAHNNLGNVLRDRGRPADSIPHYEQALRLNADFVEAHNNLGVALFAQGRWAEASRCYQRALQLNPSYAEAHNNLGNVLMEQGAPEQAIGHFQQALKERPNAAEIYHNAGNALKDMGRPDEAIQCLAHAVKLKPAFAEAHDSMGGALMDQRKYEEAIASYQQAVRLRPDFVQAHTNLGNALAHVEQIDGARASYRAAARLQPDDPLYELRLASLCPAIFDTTSDMDAYSDQLLATAERLAGRELPIDLGNLTTVASKPSFNLQFLAGNLRPIKEAYARIFAGRFPQQPCRPGTGLSRIGFVVTRNHEGIFFKSMRGVLERLDRQRFELVVLSSRSGAARLQSGIDNPSIQYVALPERLAGMLEAIRSCRLDVLYYWEVASDAANYFLPFFRLAPVQCTSWGVQVTSGIPGMDYYLSSELVEPEGAEGHYSEKLHCANTLLTYQYGNPLGAAHGAREAFGFAAAEHIYLCAQQAGKFHPDFDPILASILRTDGCGVLVITADRGGAGRAERLRRRFAASMPDVVARIRFLPRQETEDYMRLTAAADVLLDPLHFGGVNTTYDGLGMGQPIVTLPSGYHRGRYTAACYRKIGVTDAVARDGDDYVRIATRLGMNRDEREAVCERISAASHLLFEDLNAVREHERLFEELVAEARG